MRACTWLFAAIVSLAPDASADEIGAPVGWTNAGELVVLFDAYALDPNSISNRCPPASLDAEEHDCSPCDHGANREALGISEEENAERARACAVTSKIGKPARISPDKKTKIVDATRCRKGMDCVGDVHILANGERKPGRHTPRIRVEPSAEGRSVQRPRVYFRPDSQVVTVWLDEFDEDDHIYTRFWVVDLAPLRRVAEATPGPASSAPAAFDIVTSMADVEARVDGLYLARVAVSTRADGKNEYCATPMRRVRGRGQLPPRTCSLVQDVFGSAVGMAWVGMRQRGGRAIVVLAPASCEGKQCGEPPAHALVEAYRCGQLARAWDVSPAARACAADADCVLITSSCFSAVLARDKATPYLELHDRFGGTCVSPVSGACAAERRRPACRAGSCVLAP